MSIALIKLCSHCKKNKSIDFFSKNKSAKDNLQNMCKECTSSRYFANREKRALQSKESRKKNSENIKKTRFLYKTKNKKILSEKQKQYYIDNIEKRLEYARSYRNLNINKIKDFRKTQKFKISSINSSNKRRSISKQGDVTTKQLIELQQNSKVCYWCNSSLKNVKVHIDHYIPLSKGGEHTISNLVVSCAKCNMSKSAKDPILFANSIGKLI